MVAVFTFVPEMPYESLLVEKDIVSEFSGSGTEQRAALLSRDFYRWPLTFLLRTSEYENLRAFFRARRGRIEAFYWKDHLEFARTGISPIPSTSDGVATVFTIPRSGEYGGDYPIDDGNAILKRAGVAATKTVQTDDRTMTAAVAPLTGGAMTMDYHFYRRVRFEEPQLRQSFITRAGVHRVALTLREVAG